MHGPQPGGERRGEWASFQRMCERNQPPCGTAMSEAELRLRLKDSRWSKLVVLRDPVERLLSGYLNWCVEFPPEREEHQHHCLNFPTTTVSFEDFVLALRNQGNARENAHFVPQSDFCSLSTLSLSPTPTPGTTEGGSANLTRIIWLSGDGDYHRDSREALSQAGVTLRMLDRLLPQSAARTPTSQQQSSKQHITQAARAAAHDIYASDYALIERFKREAAGLVNDSDGKT